MGSSLPIWPTSFSSSLFPLQFSPLSQSCPTLWDPMDWSMPGFLVHHQLPKLAQTHVLQVNDTIQTSHPVIPFSSFLQSFWASGSFQMSQLFTSGGQSIGVSASTSVLPMNTQDRFPLGWTGDLLAVQGTLKNLLQFSCSVVSNSLRPSYSMPGFPVQHQFPEPT